MTPISSQKDYCNSLLTCLLALILTSFSLLLTAILPKLKSDSLPRMASLLTLNKICCPYKGPHANSLWPSELLSHCALSNHPFSPSDFLAVSCTCRCIPVSESLALAGPSSRTFSPQTSTWFSPSPSLVVYWIGCFSEGLPGQHRYHLWPSIVPFLVLFFLLPHLTI